jgi:peptidyl-prolyl cis-trans isomerase SurA
VRFRNSAIFLVAILLFSAFSAKAQETEAVVVDEVIAQVNDGVLTLSRINREMKEVADAIVQQQGKTPEAAKAEVEGRKAELIANLINEELLMQKGKDLGVDKEVDAEVNRQLLGRMKEFNLKNLDALYEEMRKAGVDPQQYRDSLGKNIAKDMILRSEVDGKIYYGLSSKELRDYFEKNKTKFTKPETVSLSEIFLNFAGRDEAQVKEKAKQLVAQLRSGADFGKLAVENSDRPEVQQTKGKLEKPLNVPEMTENIAKAVKPVQVGGVTDPIEVEGGIEIIRVDAREAASSETKFDEGAVRSALTYEKLPEARRKYMNDLKKDAYIKISEAYRASVTPFLNDEKTEKKDSTAEIKKTDK